MTIGAGPVTRTRLNTVAQGSPGPAGPPGKGIGGIFSVDDYGADPTGVKDSYQAFIKAIAAKDAAGGGVILTPGFYTCGGSFDMGTKPFILRGAGYGRSSIDVFGGGSWPSIVEGSVIHFPNTDSGITDNTNFLHGLFQDVALIGPGTGTSKGISANNGSNGGFFGASQFGIFNFSTGLDPGAIENQGFYSADIAGCGTGILLAGTVVFGALSGTAGVTHNSSTISFSTPQTLNKGFQFVFASDPTNTYVLSANISGASSATLTANYTGTSNGATAAQVGVPTGWTDLKFYHTQVQLCGTGILATLGTNAAFFGGLIQGNTTGVQLGSTIAGFVETVDFYNTWFEGQGYPSAPDAGPDIVFDATARTVADFKFHGCRLTSTAMYQVLGSNLVDSVLWDQCIFTQNQTIPNTAVDWIYISPPGSGSITNNSSSTVFINGDQIKGPIYEATDHVTAPYFGSNTTPAQSGVFRTFFGAAGAMKARSNLGAYDVQEVAIDGFDDVFVGDGTHGSSVVAQFKTGGFFQVSQTTGKRIAQDVTGTLDTQNGILFDQILFKKTIAASASTVAFSYGLTSGHGARVRAEWVARDTTSGDTYSATIASAVKNVASSLSIAGTATQVLGCGDAGLSTATVAVTAISSSQITFTCTPPAAYANNIDWQIRVVVLDN